jgi:1,4-dihydroxy-2-naphthoate octaprenyltransferase
VLVGSTLAAETGAFYALLFILVLIGSVLVQCGTNLTDEYADHDTDSARHKVQAPYKVIARGLLTPGTVLRGALTCFGLAALIGVYLVTRTGWPLAVVCLASVGVAYCYSAGPLPLGNVALGEPLVFIFMGPVMVLGSFYVQTQTVTWAAVWLSLPVACLVTDILIANNLRDAEEDNLSGKTTLVHLWGRQPVALLYCALLLIAFASLAALVLAGLGSWIWLAPFLLLQQAIASARLVSRSTERAELHQALRGTAQLHLRFGLLLSAALVLSPFLPG